MYTIKADDEIVHYDAADDKDFLCLSGSLNIEWNKSGTLTFVLPPNNVTYNTNPFKKLKTIITVYRGDELIWKGRILDTQRDFYGRITFNCEGWLSVLNDSIVKPEGDKEKGIDATPEAYFRQLISKHNSQMEIKKKFDNVFVVGMNNTTENFPVGSYETTLDYIQSNFIDNEKIGGRIWVQDKDIYYYADGREIDSNQVIRFGHNLLDFMQSVDASQIYTILIPTGKDDLELNDNGRNYVQNDAAVDLFGKIWRHEDFSDVTTNAKLKEEALKVLNKNIEESVTIDITAFDLSLIDVDYTSINVGEMVTVEFPYFGEPVKYPCRKSTIDVCNPANSSFLLGVDPGTFTTRTSKVIKRVARNEQYTEDLSKKNINYSITQNRVHIISIEFYRSGYTVYLAFTLSYLQKLNDNGPTIITFPQTYAPQSDYNSTVYDETKKKTYSLKITTIGQIQVRSNSEIDVGDIVSGSAVWTYTGKKTDEP